MQMFILFHIHGTGTVILGRFSYTGGQNGDDVKKTGFSYINNDELPNINDVFKRKNIWKNAFILTACSFNKLPASCLLNHLRV